MEIRRLKEHEYEEAVQLANCVFREPDHISMGLSFPQVFSKQFKQSYGAFDNDELVSFMGLVPSTIRIGESILHVYSIGAVCTREDYRERGIGTAILTEVYKYIKRTSASLVFVSGDRGLYLRNGCHHFGEKSKYTLNKNNNMKNNYFGMTRLGLPEDIFEIDEIRRTKAVNFESSLWEWHVLLEAGGFSSVSKLKQHLFVADHEDVIEGYVIIGMPKENNIQEKATVIEWGGEPKAVYSILQDVLNNELITEVDLDIMWHEEFTEDLAAYSSKIMYNGGTIAIANVGKLTKQLLPFLKSKNAIIANNLLIIESEKGIEIQYGIGTKKIIAMDEFVQLLFEPQYKTDCQLDELFPVPLPNLEGLYFV